MQIFIDADACPRQIKTVITKIAGELKLTCLFVCSVAHFSCEDTQNEYLYVDKASQAADLIIANQICAGDIVVTQDYGLAALALAKGCKAISTRGLVYSGKNIDGLLDQRYILAKVRKSGGRHGGPTKFTQHDVDCFTRNFLDLVR